MVKQPILGPFIKNLLYQPDAKKYLRYPLYTSYEMWKKYQELRKSQGNKGITNQNWLRIIYVLKELRLIEKVDDPKRTAPGKAFGGEGVFEVKESLKPVPGPNHPSGYIPNTLIFAWEPLINELGQITIDAKQSLQNYLSSKHKLDWIKKASISIEEGNVYVSTKTDIIELVPNEEFNRITIYLNDTIIDYLEIRKEKEIHMVHFIDTRLDWKRVFYKAVPDNIKSEFWTNPQLAYRIKLNSTSFQQDLATKEVNKQWKRLVKEYTNKDIVSEVNINTPIPENYPPKLKEIINFYRETGYKPYQSVKKMRKIIEHKQDYTKKLIIPPREDYVTIKVRKTLKNRIDAERGEMTISDYIESKLQ